MKLRKKRVVWPAPSPELIKQIEMRLRTVDRERQLLRGLQRSWAEIERQTKRGAKKGKA